MKRQSQTREVNLVKTQTPLSDPQNQQEVNDQIFRHVQEMFDGKVDGDVVYIILQELEWNVEKAIDTLCNMCGSPIDATKKNSKLAEIARDVLCLDKKNKSSQQQSTQNLMPSEFPALGSPQISERPHSSTREKTPTHTDAQWSDNKPPLLSPQKVKSSNSLKSDNKCSQDNEYTQLANSSLYNLGKSPAGIKTSLETSPRHVGVIGEKFNRKSRDSSLSPGNYKSPLEQSKVEKNIKSLKRIKNSGFSDSRSGLKKPGDKYHEVLGDSFPSFHDFNSSDDIAIDSSQLTPEKSSKLQSSHNSLDDIDDNFEEELDFNSSSKKVSTPSQVPHFSEGIGHSILAGALNLTTSVDNGKEKFNVFGAKQLSNQISPSVGKSTAPVSCLWPNTGYEARKQNLDVHDNSYMSNFLQSSASGTSRYSFANKSAFNSRHDSGDFDIDSLLKEGTSGNLNGENQVKDASNQSKEKGNASQDNCDLLTVESDEAIERPKSTEMQLPVVSFELSVTAKEFVPRLQKEDDIEQADEQTESWPPYFVMPKMGKPSVDGAMPIPQPRIPDQFVPGFRQPRAPFAMPLHPPWMPRGGRGPLPRGVPPWMQFPNFPEPRGGPPFLPPGGVLPVQRSNKSSTEANEKELERVKEKITSGAKLLVVLRGLPGSGKSTLAKELVGDGVILSTDDYFMENGMYNYDISKLSDAHEWNRKRAAAALEEKRTPVIIDNTNTQAWEIKPYLKLGKAFSYEMEILEPNTPWKYSVKELTRRNDHGVRKEHIQKMKERFQRDLNVENILGLPLKKSKIENGEKPKDVEFSQADFPELKTSQPGRGSPFSSPRRDSLDQEVFLRPEEFKENDHQIKFRKNSGDSLLECSTPGSDTDSEKRMEKEFDQLSDSRYSPIPANVGYVARSHLAMSTSNLHKQLEIISKRKTLMSPPVSCGSKQKEDPCQAIVEDSTISQSSTAITDTKPTEKDNIEKIVDDLISENVGSWNGDSDQDKVVDELKSLILFLPIDPMQHPQVEKMIEEKIRILSQSSVNDNNVNLDGNTANENNDTDDEEVANSHGNGSVCDTSKDQHTELVFQNIVPNTKNTVDDSTSTELQEDEIPSDHRQVTEAISENDEIPFDSGQVTKAISENHENPINSVHVNEAISVSDEIPIDHGQVTEAILMSNEIPFDSEQVAEAVSVSDGNPIDRGQVTEANSVSDGNPIDRGQVTEANSVSDGNPIDRGQVTEANSVSDGNPIDRGQVTEANSVSDAPSELSNIKASELLYWAKQEHNEENETDVLVSAGTWEDEEDTNNQKPRRQRRVSRRSPRKQKDVQVDDNEDKFKGALDTENSMHDVSKSAFSDDESEFMTDTSQVSKSSNESPSDHQDSNSKKIVKVSQSTPNGLCSSVCDTNSIALQEDVLEKDKTPAVKKNGRRKMAARFPYFNDSDVAKFSVSDWTAIKVDKLDDVKYENIERAQETSFTEKVDSETEITPQDLKIMHELNNGMAVSSTCSGELRTIDGKDWTGYSSDMYSPEKPGRICNGMTVHRSTMTEDLLEADIEFLKNSFPTIPEVHLKDVLQSCDNSVEWAADIILEWNFHDLSLSQEDKNKYLDSIFKLQRIPKSPTIPVRLRSSSTVSTVEPFKQPALLLDICVKFLEDTNIATKEDIENQLIANSQKRLLSYESNIRLCHQFSRENEGNEIFIEDDDFAKKILQELLDQSDKEAASDNNFAQHESKTEQSLNLLYIDSPQSGVFEGVSEVSCPTENQIVPIPRAESPASLTLSLELPNDFVQALLSLFGSVGKLTPETAEALTIPVDYITAQRLHQCLRTEHVENHVNRRQQISEDEALAQQLQSAMNDSSVTASNVSDRHPARESMHAIMQEQLQEERRKTELTKDLKASGYHDTMGNRMKRKKLYEEFPAIDPSVIDEIFQGNCFSYEDTIRALRGSLGSNEPPKTVMTAEAADLYERKLIEAAKQQSLQEMIYSYSYHPKAKKEFQSAENPEYEDIRGEANLHYRLRHECFQKAQEAYRRGMKQVAQFYSDQGHKHTKQIKVANENAAQMILSKREGYLETKSTLDLHGLHVDEAITVLTNVIEDQMKNLSSSAHKKKDLFIITGRGSHSRGGVARIRPAVLRWLKQRGYNFAEVREGLLKLRLP